MIVSDVLLGIDIWSTGAVARELASPQGGSVATSTLQRIWELTADSEPPPPQPASSTAWHTIPTFRDFLDHALSRNPAERATASTLLEVERKTRLPLTLIACSIHG